MPDPTDSDDLIDALRAQVEADARSDAFVPLARALNARDRHREAAEIAERGLLAHPDSMDGRLALAVSRWKLGSIREAVEQIKRALLIDQDNAEALALMGRILLEQGLAKRSVQFLTHAVNLAPHHDDYRDQLARAQAAVDGVPPPPVVSRSGAGGSAKVPSIRAESMADDASPWGDDADQEQTVFAFEAGKSEAGEAAEPPTDAFQARLAALPSMHDDVAEEEPTRLATALEGKPLPSARERQSASPPPAAPRGASSPRVRRGKVGGSAAELSGMMPADEADALRARAEARVREQADRVTERPGPAEAPDMGEAPTTALPSEVVRAVVEGSPAPKSEAKAPSVPAEVSSAPAEAVAPPAPPAEAPPSIPPVPAPSVEAKAPPVEPPAPKSSKPSETDDEGPSTEKLAKAAAATDKPAATDEPAAVEESAPAESPEKKSVEKKSVEKKKPDAKAASVEAKKPTSSVKAVGRVATQFVDDALFALLGQDPGAPAEASPEAPARRVVRTSQRFGGWTGLAAVVVFSAFAFGIGYAAAVAPGDAPPEVVGEELKGVAGELERGGLAALHAAEERISELSRSNPGLEGLLSGALAEVHARRWAHFGHAPAALEAARAALARVGEGEPTVETLYARTLVSTAAADLEALTGALDAAVTRHPDSPKALMVRGILARRRGEEAAAIEDFTQARALHPQHRGTLLATARWLADAGAVAAALSTYATAQRYHSLDVEVGVARFVLGWATGADPTHDEAVALLAGYVREEIPEVAKDEAGRAALAFALPRLAEGRAQEALNHLAEAEGAFSDSPSYQRTVGRLLLALGEAERAERCFEQAAELEPGALEPRLDLARAAYAKRRGLRLELTALRRELLDLGEDGTQPGQVLLPYGRLVAEPNTHALIRVELSPGAFPEALLADAVASGGGTPEALEAAIEGGLALDALERKDLAKAKAHLSEAEVELPMLEQIEARMLLAEGRDAAAEKRLSAAAEAGVGGAATWLYLARAKEAAEDDIGALDAYARYFELGGISPDARLAEARLRFGRGDAEGALQALDGLDALEPKNPGALLLRGEIVYADAGAEEARSLFEAALDAAPGLAEGTVPPGLKSLSPIALTELGAQVVEKDRRRGKALLERAAEAEGAPAVVHFHLGKALMKSRKSRKKGRQQLATYLSLEPSGAFAEEAERLSRKR